MSCPLEEIQAMVILENFKKSLNWIESVSMKVEIAVTPTGIPDNGPCKFVFIFNRDHDRVEWNGNAFVPDSNGNPDPKKNAILRQIITEREFVSVIGNPGSPPLGAEITTDFNGVKEDLLDRDEFGGPLFGKIYGTNHKNIPDLLSEAGDAHLRQNREDINGVSCYILEGTTKYGKVTAWIAPDKGYAALKWTFEKTGDDLINDNPMSKTEMILWTSQFESQEIQKIGQYFIPTKATFTFES